MDSIRYKISEKVSDLGLMMEDGSTNQFHFDHRNHIYFVDILECRGYLLKLRIYMPDGFDLIGRQSKDFLTLHYRGDVFDGRFNRIKEENAKN